ncbi:unnamed protein product [Ambrosiozyma monospora]|uniref:Unnamed protein product n=1 Tax=Ambrosiozyma monospora TaxID=43982 RepID=A0ACB5T774_AMBMO|nr:unnamed protein product [Ambrosiozyma monospora]
MSVNIIKLSHNKCTKPLPKTRKKTGCFCCRKRKIKCDEQKPSCYNCTRSSYKCVWPTGGQSLSRSSEFKLEKCSHRQIRFKEVNTVTNAKAKKKRRASRTTTMDDGPFAGTFGVLDFSGPSDVDVGDSCSPAGSALGLSEALCCSSKRSDNGVETEDLVNEISPHEPLGVEIEPSEMLLSSEYNPSQESTPFELIRTDSIDSIISIAQTNNDREMNKEAQEDAIFRKYLEEQIKNFIPSRQLNGYSTWLLGVDMTEEDAFFYDVFVKGFMISCSPQFAHKDLQPGAVFIPPGTQNPILRSVFYACGAAFLCMRRNEMKRVAELKYQECLDKLYSFIDSGDINGNEHWLLVAILCLCLRERYHGEDINKHIVHVTTALQVIRYWQANKLRSNVSISSGRRLSIGEDGCPRISDVGDVEDDAIPLDTEDLCHHADFQQNGGDVFDSLGFEFDNDQQTTR